MAEESFFWGTGRRKTSAARVRVFAGTGKFTVNKRMVDSYFTTDQDRKTAVEPVGTVEKQGRVDVIVNVKGGGMTGQAGAVSLGVAVSLYKDKFLLGFGWDIYDSRPTAKRRGSQDYIFTFKYSGLF